MNHFTRERSSLHACSSAGFDSASDPSKRRLKARLPLIISVYLFFFLLPIEFSISIGPLFITPTRLFFLLAVLPLLIALFRLGNLHTADWLIFAYVVWVALALLRKQGAGGIEPAGQSLLEVLVPYLIARLHLHDSAQVARLVQVLGIIICILGALAIPEAIFHDRFLHDIPRLITGVIYEFQSDTRLGLLRAASTFENPLLFGLYCATFLSMIWYSGVQTSRRVLLCFGVVVATTLSLTSAAVLLLLMQILLIAFEGITRKIPARAAIVLATLVVVVLLVEALSDRGVVRLIAGELTFNPFTGYYRIAQWEHSIDDVMLNPIFGINFEDWTRPFWMTDSIDNHWLLTAMRSGLPSVVIIFALLFIIAYRLYFRRKKYQDPLGRSLMLGWILGMSALFLGGWTVAFFGKMFPALFFLIGIGAALMKVTDEHWDGRDRPEKLAIQDRPLRFSRYQSARDVQPPSFNGHC